MTDRSICFALASCIAPLDLRRSSAEAHRGEQAGVIKNTLDPEDSAV